MSETTEAREKEQDVVQDKDNRVAQALEALENMKPAMEEALSGDDEVRGEDLFEPFLLLERMKPLVRDLIEKNKKLEREVRQKNRLKVLGEMASCLAHEIRTPLSAVHLNLERLKQETEPESRSRQMVNRIDTGLEKVQNLVDDILTYSRNLEPIPSRFRWSDMLEDVYEQLSPKLEKYDVTLSTDFENELPPLEGDREKLGRVMNNILLNAIQAAGENGEIHVQVSVDSSSSESDNCPTQLRTAVVDDGPGIPEEVKEKLFTPFESKKTKGTGLGLAIASRIVKAHNGRISGSNTEDSGAEFIVELPLQYQGNSRENSNG